MLSIFLFVSSSNSLQSNIVDQHSHLVCTTERPTTRSRSRTQSRRSQRCDTAYFSPPASNTSTWRVKQWTRPQCYSSSQLMERWTLMERELRRLSLRVSCPFSRSGVQNFDATLAPHWLGIPRNALSLHPWAEFVIVPSVYLSPLSPEDTTLVPCWLPTSNIKTGLSSNINAS